MKNAEHGMALSRLYILLIGILCLSHNSLAETVNAQERNGNLLISGITKKATKDSLLTWSGSITVEIDKSLALGRFLARCTRVIKNAENNSVRLEGCKDVVYGFGRSVPGDDNAICVIHSNGSVDFLGHWRTVPNK